MPGFKASKDRLTILLGASAASDFNLKSVLIYCSENLRPLRIMLNLFCLCLHMEQQSLDDSTSVYMISQIF